MSRQSTLAAFVTSALTTVAGAADCFDQAAVKHGVSADLLRAVARAESDMRPHAVNNTHVARTGTRDLGLMQINTGWLPTLSKWGITEQSLMDPCTNIDVGAWVLADAIRRHGNSWNAVGAYNAACTQLKGQACTAARARYAWRVYRRLPPPPHREQAPMQVAQAPRLPAVHSAQRLLAAAQGADAESPQ